MFAAIYVPDFPVEAILRADPDLREHAVAVVEGVPPLVHVIAVSEKAAQAGVEPGMTRLQAEERLAASSNQRVGTICQRSAQREAAAHAALLDCACGFSPRVEDTAADTVLLDLAGLERIFGPPGKIARDVARRCSELGLEANVAVASNADAAMHAARGFPGVTVIPSGAEAERLGRLPVDVLLQIHSFDSSTSSHAGEAQTQLPVANAGKSEILNLQSEILDTLDRWGVRNLRALAALPEIAVTERLGQEGLRWQNLARGATSRPLAPIEPPLVFEESMELEYPIGELEPLSFLLNRMLEQLCARLAARALAASELRLRLSLEIPPDCRIEEFANFRIEGDSDHAGNSSIRKFDSSSIHECILRLPVPMSDAKVFLKLLQLDLQANPPGAPVVKVRLVATPAEPRRAQDGLFLPAAPDPERLEVTLAKIKRVAGSQSSLAGPQSPENRRDNRQCSFRVGSPEILDTHRPDAFRMNNFVSPTTSVARVSDPGAWVEDPRHAVSAVRVFRPPLAARVVLRDGRPARLACPERPALAGDVTWCAGPWRSSGEWWSEQAWSREEWDVFLGDALYRIYRDATGWFVEGSYD